MNMYDSDVSSEQNSNNDDYDDDNENNNENNNDNDDDNDTDDLMGATMDESESKEQSTTDSVYSDDLSKLDSVVLSVIDKFIDRAEFGKRKYGTDLDRNDLTMLEWINHAQEEHMDAILYLEKIRNLETRRLTENPQKKDTQLKTDTLKILTQCVAVLIAIVCYNCTIVYFWSGR
jgi:hypothetical protein